MAEAKAAKEAPKKKVKKGKKKRKPKKTSEKYKKYQITGEKVERIGKFCPRCGPGIFLAESKDRFYCGKCHYVEFKSKEKAEEKTEKTEEKKK